MHVSISSVILEVVLFFCSPSICWFCRVSVPPVCADASSDCKDWSDGGESQPSVG